MVFDATSESHIVEPQTSHWGSLAVVPSVMDSEQRGKIDGGYVHFHVFYPIDHIILHERAPNAASQSFALR